MPMEYADQTSGAIRLYLTEGDFDVEQLKVVKRESFETTDFKVEFGILAASHFVQFRHGNNILSEVCACTDAIIPDNAKLLEYDFLPNLHTVPLSAQFLIFPYTFNFTYVDWKEGVERLTLLQERKNKESTLSLTYEFPKSNEDDNVDHPITEIYVDYSADLHVYTVHTYPNEDMMVFTESFLKI